MRPRLIALPLAALPLAALAMLATPVLAQDSAPEEDGAQEAAQDGAAQEVPSSRQDIGWDSEPIIVQGLREAEERVEVMTRKITRRPRVDKPISKFYSQACFGVFGMDEAYAAAIIDRMQENARRLDIPVGGEGCQVNVLVGFVTDGVEEVQKLRKSDPAIFGSLLDYEYDRIMRGNGAVQAWHGTTVKSSDGREFSGATTADGDSYSINRQYGGSTRMGQPIRVDMDGAIVLIDAKRTPGKTVRQLADYASMRAFVSVDDTSEGGGSGIDTILSLFDEDGFAPGGLTRFDKAYLEAVYKLPANASGQRIHDATWSIYRGEELDEEDEG